MASQGLKVKSFAPPADVSDNLRATQFATTSGGFVISGSFAGASSESLEARMQRLEVVSGVSF
jgi:hypothetical protein